MLFTRAHSASLINMMIWLCIPHKTSFSAILSCFNVWNLLHDITSHEKGSRRKWAMTELELGIYAITFSYQSHQSWSRSFISHHRYIFMCQIRWKCPRGAKSQRLQCAPPPPHKWQGAHFDAVTWNMHFYHSSLHGTESMYTIGHAWLAANYTWTCLTKACTHTYTQMYAHTHVYACTSMIVNIHIHANTQMCTIWTHSHMHIGKHTQHTCVSHTHNEHMLFPHM